MLSKKGVLAITMVGLLVMVMTNTVIAAGGHPPVTSTSERIWGDPKTFADRKAKIEAWARVPGEGSVLDTTKLQEMVQYIFIKNYKYIHERLPEEVKNSPKKLYDLLLRLNDVTPQYPTTNKLSFWYDVLRPGLSLKGLPQVPVEKTSSAVTHPAKDKKAVAIETQFRVVQSDLQEERTGPQVEARLKKLEASAAGNKDLEMAAGMLKQSLKKLEKMEKGEFTPGMKANINKLVEPRIAAGLAELRKAVAKNTRQIGELRTGLEGVKEATSANARLIGDISGELKAVQETVRGSASWIAENGPVLKEVDRRTGMLSAQFDELSSSANISLAAMIAALVVALIAFVLALHNLVRVRSVKQQNEFVKKRIGDLESEVQDPSRGLAAAQAAIGRTGKTEVTAMEKRIKDLENEVQKSSHSQAAAQAAIIHTGRKADVLSAELIPDESNPSEQELLKHAGGRKAAQVLKYFGKDGEMYQVEVWRYAKTPKGMVCVNIIRKIGSTELVAPIAVRNLPDVLRRAIAAGRHLPAETKNGGVVDVEKSGDEKSQTEGEHIPAYVRKASAG